MGNDLIERAIMNLSDENLADLNNSYAQQTAKILKNQGNSLVKYRDLIEEIALRNKDPNCDFLIKGDPATYVSRIDSRANNTPVSIRLNEEKESDSSDEIPLILEAGLSAVFLINGPESLYIEVRKELSYSGNLYLSSPIEVIRSGPKTATPFYFLKDLFLHINDYSSSVPDRFDAVFEGLGSEDSSSSERIFNYLEALAKRYGMKLDHVNKSHTGDIQIHLDNPFFKEMETAFKVPEAIRHNDFNTEFFTSR